jgi:hypothetical protein
LNWAVRLARARECHQAVHEISSWAPQAVRSGRLRFSDLTDRRLYSFDQWLGLFRYRCSAVVSVSAA